MGAFPAVSNQSIRTKPSSKKTHPKSLEKMEVLEAKQLATKMCRGKNQDTLHIKASKNKNAPLERNPGIQPLRPKQTASTDGSAHREEGRHALPGSVDLALGASNEGFLWPDLFMGRPYVQRICLSDLDPNGSRVKAQGFRV